MMWADDDSSNINHLLSGLKTINTHRCMDTI